MVGVITIFIISSIIWGYLFFHDSITKLDYLTAIVCGLGAGFICTVILTLAIAYAIDLADPEIYSAEEIATYDISAMNDNYISQYYEENGPCYSFLYSTNNGLKMETIDADNAIIVYTEKDPYIVANNIRFVNPILNFFYGPNDTGYTIYIPEGSVIQDTYRIDLE